MWNSHSRTTSVRFLGYRGNWSILGSFLYFLLEKNLTLVDLQTHKGFDTKSAA